MYRGELASVEDATRARQKMKNIIVKYGRIR